MIRSFRGTLAALIFQQRRVPKGFPTDVAKVTRRKLVQLNNATMLGDLVAPPGNRLEPLRGERAGRFSIRINAQFRICFEWRPDGVHHVEIVGAVGADVSTGAKGVAVADPDAAERLPAASVARTVYA